MGCLPITFAARLRSLRQAGGLSIPQLAAAAGLPRQTLHKLENGERQPYWETVCKLAGALAVSTDVFR